jgi:hypothetical protein
MKKLAIILILVLVGISIVFSQAKPGGIARQAAMGGSFAGQGLVLNPFIMMDPALILVNPAYQDRYKDYMWSNLAGGRVEGLNSGDNGYGHQNAGIAFGVSDAFTLGAILSYDPSSANGNTSNLSSYPQYQRESQSIPQIENVWEVVGSYQLSKLTLGLGLMYGWSNHNDKDDRTSPVSSYEYEMSSSMMGIRAGAIFDLNEKLLFDFSAQLRLDNATDKKTFTPAVTGDGGEYKSSGTEMVFAARACYKMNNKFNVVPYAMIGFANSEPKEETPPTGATAATASLKYSRSLYAFGIGGEYRTQTFYLAGGISYQHASFESDMKRPGTATDTLKGTYSYTGFPVVNLGGEWWFTEWLCGRIGYFRSIGSEMQKDEYPRETWEHNESYNFSAINIGELNGSSYDGIVTLGVGFKFGGFSLEATVSEDALRRGLGLIGSYNGINTFGYMTASYNFAE